MFGALYFCLSCLQKTSYQTEKKYSRTRCQKFQYNVGFQLDIESENTFHSYRSIIVLCSTQGAPQKCVMYDVMLITWQPVLMYEGITSRVECKKNQLISGKVKTQNGNLKPTPSDKNLFKHTEIFQECLIANPPESLRFFLFFLVL